MLTVEVPTPLARRGIATPYARLAAAVLAQAAADARKGDKQASEWLRTPDGDAPLPLRMVCEWLSLALGEEVDPEAVAECPMRYRPRVFYGRGKMKVGGR